MVALKGLEEYVSGYSSRFVRGVHDRSRLCFDYVSGLMSYSKSNIERMAEHQQIDSQQLHHFISVLTGMQKESWKT